MCVCVCVHVCVCVCVCTRACEFVLRVYVSMHIISDMFVCVSNTHTHHTHTHIHKHTLVHKKERKDSLLRPKRPKAVIMTYCSISHLYYEFVCVCGGTRGREERRGERESVCVCVREGESE